MKAVYFIHGNKSAEVAKQLQTKLNAKTINLDEIWDSLTASSASACKATLALLGLQIPRYPKNRNARFKLVCQLEESTWFIESLRGMVSRAQADNIIIFPMRTIAGILSLNGLNIAQFYIKAGESKINIVSFDIQQNSLDFIIHITRRRK